ncbi:HD domain-containing protein [Fistulina hepatica ATCC 64428]|uniref:5'-deoxynucleotidase n=1 Tax=Fistulina hepatica ATCC 64428 TaxID=1128425 RepID=A0A0D7A2I0_9AGAR|nr:HD domain-containing protein [Fistulina hepatica ATCC 64428]
MSETTTNARTHPPLYSSGGSIDRDRLEFFHVIERLKTQKRTGWVHNGIPSPESVAEHMYRMAMLAMCCTDESLDVSRCVMMALVHDLAEAQVGDIAPHEGIPKVEKQRLEAEAMHNFMHEMLHDNPVAKRIEALWKEYEDGNTPEAKFVKGACVCAAHHFSISETISSDLDRLEMALQASEYERRYNTDLQPFYDSSIPHIRHPDVQCWGRELEIEREECNRNRSGGA